MTDREIMEQALDALEEGLTSKQLRELTTALRERLAQPNDFNPDWDAMAVMVEEQQRMAKRIAELEAQPEQEQAMLDAIVGGIGFMLDGKRIDPATIYKQPEQEPVAHTLNCVCGAVWDVRSDGVEEMVHAPTTPQRKWVGLTKEEAKEISLANRPYVIDMVAALEARLKEKNGG